MIHKFKVGDYVRLERTSNRIPDTTFEVTRLLPLSEAGEFQYHVRSAKETHARFVRESELQRLYS